MPTNNKVLVRSWFDEWLKGNSAPLFDHIADDVVWSVPGTFPGSGTYRSKQEFFEKSARPVAERLNGPSRPASVTNIYADGDAVIVEWLGTATTKSGKEYDNTYCWVMHLEGGIVRKVVSYIDTALVAELFRTEKV
jgi:ketosteroid isomerase-like protein